MTTLDAWIDAHRDAHLDELKALLSIPSVSTAVEHAGDVKHAAGWVRDRLAEAGLEARVYETEGHPIVYGEWLGAEGAPTVLIYGHYDVQPADPLELWRNPPFEPTIESTPTGDILVARGATDDKGQFYCHVKGIQAHMATHGALPVNVKVLIEGEEEVGSDNLEPFLREHAEMLSCDAVVVSDTPMHGKGLPSITYGLRGMAALEVTVTGPSHDLHSGLYGGGVRNPLNALAAMIGSLHDDEGRITIDGFYDDVEPLSDDERAAFVALNHDEDAFRAEVGVADSPGEAGYTVYECITSRPTLDVNGMWGGYIQPGFKTVLPSKAHAKISCRLVPHQDPDTIAKKVAAALEAAAPTGVTVEVTLHHGASAVIADRTGFAVQAAMRAQSRVWGVDCVFTRGGGSIPVVASFKNILDADTVLMGLGNEDDRLHSPNEKFGVENYFNGIKSTAYLLEELAAR